MRSTWPNQFNRCAPYLTFYILPHALRAPPIPCNSALSKVLQRATNFSHYHSPHAIALDAVMNSLVVLAARDWCDSAIEPAATHTHTYWISLIGAQSVQITTHTHTHPHTHTHTHTHPGPLLSMRVWLYSVRTVIGFVALLRLLFGALSAGGKLTEG